MDQTLKEKILKLFQDNEDICVDYSLFLDSKADTEFVGCTGKEKKKYWDIFQHMEQKAPGTKIVIHIYDEQDSIDYHKCRRCLFGDQFVRRRLKRNF